MALAYVIVHRGITASGFSSNGVAVTEDHPQSNLPDLRIVSAADLLLHEEYDSQHSAQMAERLVADGVLKNPPVVAPIAGEKRYVVLDGANRVTALQSLGFLHVVVQVVNYEDPELVLESWYHLVIGIPCVEFNRALSNVVGQRLEASDLNHARAELARREALAYMICPGNAVRMIHAEGDLFTRTTQLNEMVSVYKLRGQIYRVNTDHLEQLSPYYDDITVLVAFPRYQLAEITELARIGARLPTGITRFIIPRRVLHINFPLNRLRDDCPRSEKNLWLKNFLKQKVSQKEIRFYQESTYMFDE
jgi:hypothetical protein